MWLVSGAKPAVEELAPAQSASQAAMAVLQPDVSPPRLTAAQILPNPDAVATPGPTGDAVAGQADAPPPDTVSSPEPVSPRSLPQASSRVGTPPAAAQAPAAEPATKSSVGAYVLQLGAFREAANARRMQAQLERHGHLSYAKPGSGAAQDLILVRMGGFPDRVSAAAAAARVLDDTGIVGLVMRAGS